MARDADRGTGRGARPPLQPLDLLRRVARDGEAAVLFDGGPQRGWGDAIVAARPASALCVRDGRAWRRQGEGMWRPLAKPGLAALRAFVEASADAGIPGVPFPYGVVLLASYDAGRLFERIPETALDDTRLPQVVALRFDAAYLVPAQGPALLLHREGADTAARELERRARSPPFFAKEEPTFGPVVSRTSAKDFEAMVARAKERVKDGEIFQANLSHRLETTTTAHPLEVYARLREANPAPFSAYLASGPLPSDPAGFHVLSSSPERLFRVDGRRIEARPIAGTRPRGRTREEDERLRDELANDPKEQAEHVMLVDLARNDLGRVCRFGSVRVPRLLGVEPYRTVQHLVSHVEGELAEGKDALDALAALFPGGTITGAPKVRAMEIIEELEPVRRGVYTGSLGWISPRGDCDLNILIRTLLVRQGKVHLQVGAGVVEDSVPHREYEETLAKAKGLLLALGK